MADPVPQKAYDEAAAVFSRKFSFVEWRFVIAVKQGTSTPFGDVNEPRRKATTKIDREKWVYVFANNGEYETWAEIKEEIKVDKDGNMSATPFEELDKERTKGVKRKTLQALGKTMCLPRRIVGKPQVYRFFASRIQLPMAQIKELMGTVMRFAPPVILDPGDKNLSVIEQDDETLLVPVVDPITVALHLHAAFAAAADDIINYTAAFKENKDSRAVERRRKKQFLASILKSIIGEADKKEANNLVHELKGQQGPLEDFLTHYEREIQARVDRRDRLASFLVRWMQSGAMDIMASAYESAAPKKFEQFLVPWSHAITRMNESPGGREFLDKLLGDQKHFFNSYVWLKNDPKDDAIQAIRKSGMTVFEAWKTLAERRAMTSSIELADEVYEKFHKLRGEKNTPLPKGLTKGQRNKAKLNRAEARKEFNKQLDLIRESQAQLLKDLKSSDTKTHFAVEPRALGALVEAVNFVVALKSMMEALKGDDAKAQELAVVNFIGSTLDTASAIAALSKRFDKIAPVLSFVSGVIDVYLAHEAMNKAFKDGDQEAANGSFIVGVGATIGGSSFILAAMGVPGLQIVIVLGLLVVAIGYIYKLLTGKEPIERFFARCTWGKDYLTPGGGDWSPTRFEQWTEEGSGKEFEYQLEALLNIICKFEISHGSSFRELKFKMGWVPPNSILKVKYSEDWDDSSDDRPLLEDEVEYTDQGPKSKQNKFFASAEGKNVTKVVIPAGLVASKPTHVTELESIDGVTFESLQPNKALNKVVAQGRLHLTIDGTKEIVIPHKDWEKKTLHDD